MNRIILPIVLLSGFFKAQVTPTENYIYTKTYLTYPAPTDANQIPKIAETVQYLDGLGRVKQSINIKSTPQGKDIVTHSEYDAYGRQLKEYLPVPQVGTQNGGIYDTPLNNATDPTVYGNEKIYAENLLESSPLDRIKKQFQVGSDWNNKPVQFNYDANVAGEVNKYIATFNYSTFQLSISLSGTYGDNQLYKDITIDEDGNQTIEFKNGEGQLLLVRKMLDDKKVDTYYVYNQFNQLAFVIPPLASSLPAIDDTTLNNLCYQYKYDGRNRLVEKKIPGKGWQFMVYDKHDRVVLTQDASLGTTTTNSFGKKGWLFSKYDQFGRVVYTGFFTNTATRSTMQTAINNMAANPGNNEVRSNTPFTLNGLDIYYTKNAFPTGSMTVLSVNYYDTYPTGAPAHTSPILGQEVLQSLSGADVDTKSLPVALFVKNIDDDNWTKLFNWYDAKGRIIGTNTLNHLGGYTNKESLLDFTGNVNETYTYHKRTGSDTEVKIKETFGYDSQNRIISGKHKVDNLLEQPLFVNSYNEKVQLVNKKIGINDDRTAPLQSVDYKYNIRGWMTDINDPENLGNDLFAMKLKYQNPQDANYGVAQYNGNISEVDWKTVSDGIYRRYTYNYDNLSRLTKGIFLTPFLASETENHFYDEEITYDLNSNIKTLDRFQSPDTGNIAMHIDKLVYEYDNNNLSNKLIKVTDQKNNPSGYPLGGNIIGYDLNGNMNNQNDKGISSIVYNYLNLPKQIKSNQGDVTYLYSSDGEKLKKTFGTKNTEYLDSFLYENGSLKLITTSEGTFDFERSQYLYDYKDHLGNVRFTYASSDGGGMIYLKENNYYPFGLQHNGYNSYNNLSDFNIPYNDRYNGKELQENGMYDYGARFYMPELGRWGVIDPRSQYTHEAYSYVWNNPISFADPSGMQGEQVSDWITNGKGGYKWDPKVTGPENTPNGWKYIGPTGSYRVPGATVQLLEGGKKFTDIDEVAVSGVSPAAAAIVLTQNARFGVFAFLAVASWYVISDFVNTTPIQYGTKIDPMMHSPHTMNSDSDSDSGDDKDINGSEVPKEGDGNNKPTRNERAQQKRAKQGNNGATEYNQEAEHTSGARGSTKQTHENGLARKAKDKGGEKADSRRKRYK